MVYKDVCLKGLPDEGLDNCLSLKERATLVRNYVGLDKRSRLDVTRNVVASLLRLSSCALFDHHSVDSMVMLGSVSPLTTCITPSKSY